MFSIEDFIVMVYCIVDDNLQELLGNKRLRSRGFDPTMSDAEVITLEIVGEFLGIDTDKGIWEYFGRHWRHFFPTLPCRTTFARQAANLWYWKQRLQAKLAQQLGAFLDPIHLVDGLPMPVCKFARAHFSKMFRGEATYGYCASKDETYYGFHGHLLISANGIITAFSMTQAHVDERPVLWELIEGIRGLLLGDKGYISAPLREALKSYGIDLQTALRENMHDDRNPKWIAIIQSMRRLIETVIGQLTDRFGIEKVRARDLWHQTSRVARKLLGHTVAVAINMIHGRSPLQFDGLVAAE